MSGYRESARETHVVISGKARLLCRLFGHRWWSFYVSTVESVDDMPRMCLRCSRAETRGVTVDEMDEAVKRFEAWAACRGAW